MTEELKGMRIGAAMTGSFCTFETAFSVLTTLKEMGADLYPILSYNAYEFDTRFFSADEVRARLMHIVGRDCWHEIAQVEPIGPKKLLDLMLVMPCTGNTLAKLAHGIADTPVTMACKSHWRNGRPVVLAISTNDGLSGNAQNIGSLMARKNTFFVPFMQDDPDEKPTSVIFDPVDVPRAVAEALQARQAQPLLKSSQ